MKTQITLLAFATALGGALAFGFVAEPELQAANTGATNSQTVGAAPISKRTVQKNLQQAFGSRNAIEVKEVASLANGQVLEVEMTNGQLIHMTSDMQHVITGAEVLALKAGHFENLTQARMDPKRAKLMAAVDNDETIIFKAKGEEKGLINVFTDIDCGYCRKLHKEVPELNEMGITVRYLAYPRAGEINPRTGQLTSSFKKIKSVWCNANPAQALTQAKQMKNVAENLDCDAPINEQMALGQQVGVTGTPAIVFDDGRFVGGYRPAASLVQELLSKNH